MNKIKNIPIDPFISHMRIAYEDGIRNETEAYWRERIIQECLTAIQSIPKEDGGYCHVLHACDVEEVLYSLMKRGR